jgi:hypothetical protein
MVEVTANDGTTEWSTNNENMTCIHVMDEPSMWKNKHVGKL